LETIIYPLIPSIWGEEIKYSLRSIDKFLNLDFRVIVYGSYKPNWLNTNVVEFVLSPIFESSVVPKVQFNQGIIYKKIIAREDIDNFIFFNDDIYLIQPISSLDKVYFRDTKLFTEPVNKTNNSWRRLLQNTRRRLQNEGNTSYNFETHIPYKIDAKKLSSLLPVLEGTELLATSYYNTFGPKENLCRCNAVKTGCYDTHAVHSCIEELKLDTHIWFNHNDNGLAVAKNVLPKMFPKKSKFEC